MGLWFVRGKYYLYWAIGKSYWNVYVGQSISLPITEMTPNQEIVVGLNLYAAIQYAVNQTE